MSFVQEMVLQEFLAGAYEALQRASSPDTDSTASNHEIPASIQTVRNGATNKIERHGLPESSIPEKTAALQNHDVILRNAGLTTAYKITIPDNILDSVPQNDREDLKKVMVCSELIETGIAMPAIIVPPTLKEVVLKIMSRSGLSANPDWHPYKEGAEFGVTDVTPHPHIKAEPMFQITLNLQNFEKMGKALGRGMARNDNE